MKHLLFLVFLFSLSSLSAQIKVPCGDQLIKYQLETQYPGISKVIDETFKRAKTRTSQRADLLRIPVVFHILYNKDEENLSESIIRSQLDVLNEDFRRLNSNASETRDIFKGLATDAEIEFFLAGEEPNGNLSNGITRTFTEKESFIDISFEQFLEAFTECGFDINDPDVLACIEEFLGDIETVDIDSMKSAATGGKDPWDTQRYLNIWVANLSIESAGMQVPFILGFAYPPMEAPNWPTETFPEDLASKDGVVLHYQTVGRNNPNSGSLAGVNDQGRTAVHEVGHYLGLRHIWGDGECDVDDGISDTPTAGSNSQATVDVTNCTDLHTKDSCTDDMIPDMIENYMDYSLESCQNMFTRDQVDIMRSMLEGPRSGLLLNDVSGVNNQLDSKLVIYPNPSTGQINVLGDVENLTLKVYDRTGALILQSNNSSFFLNATPGLYFLELDGPNHHRFEKIIIK